MASRFRIPESPSSSAVAPPVAWCDLSMASGLSTSCERASSEPLVETLHSSTGIHSLAPFSLDSIEPLRPSTGKLVHPSILPSEALPWQTSTLRPPTAFGVD